MAEFISKTVGDGAPGGLDMVAFTRPMITSNDMEAGVRKFFAAGRALYKSRMFIAAGSIIWLGLYLDGQNKDATQPIVIPQGNLGEPTGPTPTGLPAPTSTTSGCLTTKTGASAVRILSCPF